MNKKTKKTLVGSPVKVKKTKIGETKIPTPEEQMQEQFQDMPKNDGVWQNRVLVFTPTTGLVRAEWVRARYGQVIPTNWSMVDMVQYLSSYMPIMYQLADAQNLMAKKVVEEDYQWVIYVEHDNVLPPDGFWKFNEYINENKIPVVSGLYFTKSEPAEPILYRGRGNSFYKDWKLGDKVWVDGIPFGFRLENAKLIKEAWKTSPEYWVGNVLTRRVFESPSRVWWNEERQGFMSKVGTSDLAWCTRIMEEKLLEKAGFPEIQKLKYPFLVDTNIFVGHIDQDGRQYPLKVPDRFLPTKK